MLSFQQLPSFSRRNRKYKIVDENTQKHGCFQKLSNSIAANPLLCLCFNIGLLALSLIILLNSALQHSYHISEDSTSVLKQCSGPSPLFDRLKISMVTKRMNATLLPSPTDEIFRNEPGPEVDKAWRRISDERPIVISREEVIAIGKDPEKAVRFPDSFGFGEAYAARIDVFHQIHCLDALRREAYFDHYYGGKYPDFNSTTKLHKTHLSHCVYYLLQNIMCQASIDVYTHVWTDTLLQPFPDFQINHQCKNFDAILDWQQRSSVGLHEFYKLRKPEKFGPAMKMSAEFKEVWKESDTFNHEADQSKGGHIG